MDKKQIIEKFDQEALNQLNALKNSGGLLKDKAVVLKILKEALVLDEPVNKEKR